jgi:hypothetical protein
VFLSLNPYYQFIFKKKLMKNLQRVILCIVILTLLGGSAKLFSQTTGKLNFSVTTLAPSGNWGNKHVLAIWIESTASPSVFIKTKAKYGSEDDHLTSWSAKSGKSTVDATTGPTITSYDTKSVIWNGTTVANVVVPDGDYKVFVEMGWGSDKVNQHAVTSFTFTKGPSAVHLTPTGTTNYSNVTVDWVPTATLVESVSNNSVSVYPNPSKGLLYLKMQQSIPSAKLSVVNSLGAVVYQKNIEEGYTGNMNIDLSSFSNGLYFVKLKSPEQEFVYKVILQK